MNLLVFIAGMIVGFLIGFFKAFAYMEKEIQACSKLKKFKGEIYADKTGK